MRQCSTFIESLRKRGLDDQAIEASLGAVKSLEDALILRGCSLERPEQKAVEAWLEDRLAAGENVESYLVPAARYFSASGATSLAVRLMARLTPIGVLPAMLKRLGELEGSAAREFTAARMEIPAAGSPPESYVPATASLVEILESTLGQARARRVLAWNVHGLDPAAFLPERTILRKLGSIDAWLADHHRRQVRVLRTCAENEALWFEQKITPEVVDFVDANPEILSGLRCGGQILFTKIPYDPARYLESGDPLERRRLACHCPLAASSITAADAGVSPTWCNCSAGFVKFRFDVAFGEETEATVVESVLSGGDRCRFAIDIPASALRFIR